MILKCLYSLAKNALVRSIVRISRHILATAYSCVVKGSRKGYISLYGPLSCSRDAILQDSHMCTVAYTVKCVVYCTLSNVYRTSHCQMCTVPHTIKCVLYRTLPNVFCTAHCQMCYVPHTVKCVLYRTLSNANRNIISYNFFPKVCVYVCVCIHN